MDEWRESSMLDLLFQWLQDRGLPASLDALRSQIGPNFRREPHVQAFFAWLEIRETDGGYPFPSGVTELATAADHSALLHRLLEGKEPLDEPPPRNYSTPWYSLIDRGRDTAYSVSEFDVGGGKTDQLYVDQYVDWYIVERPDSHEWIATYGSGKHYFRFYREQEDALLWTVERVDYGD